MKLRYLIIGLLVILVLTAACAAEPQQVEVTRIVNQELPVTVEVTRIIMPQVPTMEIPTAVPVEVTRLVEVVVTPTTAAGSEETAVAPSPAATALPTANPGSTVYTIQPGDNLSLIAAKTGTAVTDILTTNNLTRDSILKAGQELTIPGWDGTIEEVDFDTSSTSSTDNPPAPVPSDTPVELTIQGANLLPNPSFEGDWYFYLYNELQVADGWQLATDEGPNTLNPGAGGLFNRPEVRVVPYTDLPEDERSIYIFEGSKTIKAFKGGAPTSFSFFTDVSLQPGTYRLQINFFPDTVASYKGGNKRYATDPLSAEMRIIHDGGGTNWQTTQIGQRNTVTYDFTVTEAATVRLGASFRNRFIMANNGWFLDDWSLYALATP